MTDFLIQLLWLTTLEHFSRFGYQLNHCLYIWHTEILPELSLRGLVRWQ